MNRQTDVDVIVVGAGNAALAAALSARQAGAEVLVLEAAPREERGGNSTFTGGFFRFPYDGIDDLVPLLSEEARTTWLDRVVVKPYPEDEFRSDLETTSRGRCDQELTDVFVSQAFDAIKWLHAHGVEWEFPVGKVHDPDKLPDGGSIVLPPGASLVTVGEGVGLMESLFAAVERAGIEVWYDAPAETLIRTGPRVEGVRVRQADGWHDVRGVVVLAAGGFGANPEMRQTYLGPGWDLVKVRGSRFATGRMLRHALDAGAQPAGHWGGCHASPLAADAPDVGEIALTDKMSRYSYPYSVMVNVHGARFVDEGSDHLWMTYAKTGSAIREQPNALAFQIFDQKTVDLLEPRYELSAPTVADTLVDLATSLGIDSKAFQRTIEEYNAATRPGTFVPLEKDGLATDPTLDPPKSNWALPIDEPPFVAYKVTCGMTFTYGGVRIDTNSRVIDVEGRPMPGLYATGEIIGGIFYHNYPAGSGLPMGSVFGRIAGERAAREAAAGVRT